MGIVVNLDVMMAKRKMNLTELAGEVDITLANLSILKNNKGSAASRETFWSMCRMKCEKQVLVPLSCDWRRRRYGRKDAAKLQMAGRGQERSDRDYG